jgi:hypothetical protein
MLRATPPRAAPRAPCWRERAAPRVHALRAAAGPDPAHSDAAVPAELLFVLERRGEGCAARAVRAPGARQPRSTLRRGRGIEARRAARARSWAEEIFPHVSVQRRAAPAVPRGEEVCRRARVAPRAPRRVAPGRAAADAAAAPQRASAAAPGGPVRGRADGRGGARHRVAGAALLRGAACARAATL